MPAFLIADHQSIVRLGVKFMIAELYPGVVTAEAETFPETLSLLREKQFDMLLLDVQLPGGNNGPGVVKTVRRYRPHMPLPVFSGGDELQAAPGCLRAGANGYLSKNARGQDVKKAIAKILNGEQYLSPALEEKLIGERRRPQRAAAACTAALTDREKEVMRLLVQGAGTREIRVALNIPDSTVSTCKTRIFGKLKVSNVIELADKVRAVTTVS